MLGAGPYFLGEMHSDCYNVSVAMTTESSSPSKQDSGPGRSAQTKVAWVVMWKGNNAGMVGAPVYAAAT